MLRKNEDSVQRLQPACLLGVGWQPDDLDEETESLIEDFDALELDGLILLWAYARYAATTWGAEFFAGTKIKAGVIKSEIAPGSDSISRSTANHLHSLAHADESQSLTGQTIQSS